MTPSPTPARTPCTDPDVEYLVRRYTLEKAYLVAGEAPGADGEPVLASLDASRFGYPLPVAHFEPLRPLMAAADVVLFRFQGVHLQVLVLSTPREPRLADALARETMVAVAEGLDAVQTDDAKDRPHLLVQVLQVHRTDPGPEALAALDGLAFVSKSHRVTVVAAVVGAAQGTVHVEETWPQRLFGWHRYLRRILRETDEPEHRMVERMLTAGLHLPALAGGVLGGALLALGLGLLLAMLGVEWDDAYGLVNYVGALVAVGVAVLARRIRSASALQGGLAGLGYGLVLYGTLVGVFGVPLGWVMGLNTLVFTLLGVSIGGTSEME